MTVEALKKQVQNLQKNFSMMSTKCRVAEQTIGEILQGNLNLRTTVVLLEEQGKQMKAEADAKCVRLQKVIDCAKLTEGQQEVARLNRVVEAFEKEILSLRDQLNALIPPVEEIKEGEPTSDPQAPADGQPTQEPASDAA